MLTEFEQGPLFDFVITWLPDLLGCIGAVIVLVAYGLLQMGKMKARSFLYSFLNLVAALLILISLMYAWNLAAALIEVAWIGISAYGVIRGFPETRQKSNA